MTIKEEMKYLNKRAMLKYQGLTFLVTIEDVRHKNGVREYLVFPVHGDGSMWTPTLEFLEDK